MFQERPFRQRKQSLLSIWWFVGLMSCGLAAWHLELIPFAQPDVEQLTLLHEAEQELASDPAEWNSAPFSLAPETVTAARPLQPVSRDVTIQPVHYSRHATDFPQQPPGQAEEPPADEREFPVRPLIYQPHVQPVTIQPIPSHRGEIPVRTASYEVRSAGYQTPAAGSHSQTDSVSAHHTTQFHQEPAPMHDPGQLSPAGQADANPVPVAEPLAPEIERDILRLRELSTRYWEQSDLRVAITPELEELSRKIYFEPQTHYLSPYPIQPGDQLRLIARNYQVSWQYLARLNRIEPEQIRAGQTLKVIKGPFDAVVDLSDKRITVHAHGYYMGSFRVGTGRDDGTPTGQFVVLNKVENPTYYGPNGVIPADDPSNPLGEHWIDLGNGYGIHGTLDPSSIGESVSKGCIRMLADDVAVVYDLLTTESTVLIRP